MKNWLISLTLFTLSTSAFAQNRNDIFSVNVSDVTGEYRTRMDSILPAPSTGIGCLPTDPWCGTLPDPINPGGGFDFSTIFTVGQKVWDFMVTNKPTAEYKSLRASVLPGGATTWNQLKGWSKPVAKVYRVQFKNTFGKDAGGFDYRLVFIYGGSYQGKGKYIGQISFAPLNVKLKTDRALNVKAELLDALNFGTEEDPIAGAQLLITWHSQTTLRYTMNSIEYFLYGTGDVQDISNGTGKGLPVKIDQF
jgi:hypothetical protein